MSGPPMREHGRAPRLLAAATVAAAALLSGCSAVGEVHVGTDEVTIDVVVRHRHTYGISPCWHKLPPGITARTLAPEESDEIACHLTGSTPLEALPDDPLWGRQFLSADDGHLFLVVPKVDVSTTSGEDSRPPPEFDLTVHVPGTVVASTGEVDGGTIRWRDPADLRDRGLAATVRLPSPVPGWLAPAGLGLLAGGAATGALLWVERRLTARRELDEPFRPPSLPLTGGRPIPGPEDLPPPEPWSQP